MKNSYLLIAIIAFILILWAWYSAPHRQHPIPNLTSAITEAPIIDEVVVVGINLPPNTTPTPADIESGKYPILGFEIQPGEYIFDIPRRIGRHLFQFDIQENGILDPSDPVFANLALGYISPDGKTVKFVSLQDVGIRDIILDMPNMILAAQKGLPPGMWNTHHTFVMSDNSRWHSYHVPIPSGFLSQLKSSDPSQVLLAPLPPSE